jgi:S1-C subfamily serine protease
VLCVPTEQDAHDLTDALASLAVVARSAPDKPNIIPMSDGMDLKPVPDKELKKHPEQSGCLVKSVNLDSPPQQAGLKDGDIVNTVDGKPCLETADQDSFGAAVLADTFGKPEASVTHVQVYRKGQLMPFDLHYPNMAVNFKELLHDAADRAQKIASPAASAALAGAPSPGFHLGIQVRAVTDADVTPMALAKARGIVVVDVEKGSLAEKMGLQPGDVILEVNNSEIGDVELFTQYVHSGAVKKFRIWRKGQALELAAPESL